MSRLENFKQLQKELQNDIHAKLQSIMAQLIPGSLITVTVADDIEEFVFNIIMENKISKTTMTVTENVLIYNINDPDNLIFKGSGKVVIYKAKENNNEAFNTANLYSLASTHAEIDLRTLYSLRNRLKEFVTKEGLISGETITREEVVDMSFSDIKEIKEEDL